MTSDTANRAAPEHRPGGVPDGVAGGQEWVGW